MSVSDSEDLAPIDGQHSSHRILPDDILHVLCEALAHQRDFDTLFRCALTGKRMALPALTHLYRSHHVSPVRDEVVEPDVPLSQQELVVQRWSIMWRSIISSALDMTMHPYCRYIKVLNLRDLQYLLEDDKFRGTLASNFFSGKMSQFDTMGQSDPKRGGKKRPPRLDINTTILAIGEALTQHTPTLEQISGNIQSSALINWAPRLPRLKSLELWEGTALAESEAQDAIHGHCPQFEALSFYTWEGDDVDAKLSAFIGNMKPQQLKYFEVISRADIGDKTFKALSTHGQSLKTLKVALKTRSLEHLSQLKSCTGVEILELEHNEVLLTPIDLERTHKDVYLEMGNWLRSCKNLTTLNFTGFVSAAPLVTPLLLEEDTNLRGLKVDWYAGSAHRDFHRALAHQSKLQSLFLRASPEAMQDDDIDILVQSLTQLKELRELKLTGISDYFEDKHIIPLVKNLPNLEEIDFTGCVTDDILPILADLKHLRRVDVGAMSYFTMNGLLDFVSKLGPGNRGIVMSIDSADLGTMLSKEELMVVRDALMNQVDGRLGYEPWRDPEIMDSETSDSD